jgi:hypothetical protein
MKGRSAASVGPCTPSGVTGLAATARSASGLARTGRLQVIRLDAERGEAHYS